jgi:hypothetical protein
VRFGRSILRPFHQLWQLSDVEGNAPSFVARQQSGGSASAGFVLIIDVVERLPISIADDEASAVVFKVPWRQEAAARLLGHTGHLSADERGD